MPRRSQFEHLKSDVLVQFQKGLEPKDVYGKFPEIPRKTVRNWFGAQLPPRSPLDCPHAENEAGKEISDTFPLGPISKRSHLSVMDGDECDDPKSDVRWVKRQLRNILRSEKNSAIRVQALNTFLRTIQIEASIRPAKLNINLSELSDQQLEQLAAGEPIEAIVN